MTISRWLSRALALGMVATVLALAGCSSNVASPQSNVPTNTPASLPTNTATSLPTATPTLTPPMCGANFSSTYYSALPDATFKATNVYAQIPLPPETRSFDNDAAGGVRGRQMCSAGTTQSVLDFMTQHLVQLGWQQVDTDGHSCLNAGNSYGKPQCWQNGNYALFLGINSATDWIILFRDPDFM